MNNRSSTLRKVTSGVLVVALSLPSFAWAAPTTPPTQEQMAEARRRYERALELSEEGNYDDALVELQRAYSLAPTYRLLYNLGVVSAAVRDYVKAIDYFNRYLIQGGSEIEPARATEVQAQIERLKNRIATIRIDVNEPNADIAIDDVSVGKAPLPKPITVNAGRHKLSASLQGYLPTATYVEVAGNDNKSLTLSLVKATIEKPSRPVPWVGWGITGALAVGTTITGIVALNAASSYDDTVNRLGVSGDDVASSYRKMRTWSVTCDALLAGTIIAAGVSLYFTLKSPKQASDHPEAAFVTPNGFRF